VPCPEGCSRAARSLPDRTANASSVIANETVADVRRVGVKCGTARVYIVAALVVVLGVLGLLTWHFWQPPTMSHADLPDGTRITLRGVTYGKNHRFELAGPLQVWMNRHRLISSTPPARNDELIEPHSVVWFSLRSATEVPPGQGGGTRTVFHTLLEDDHGCRYSGDDLEITYGMGDPDEQLAPVMLPEEPAEGALWRIRGIPVSGNEAAFDFVVRGKGQNSPNQKPTTLIPRSLPQTRSSGRVRATLRSFWQDKQPNSAQWFAAIDAVSSDKPDEKWEPTSIVATDRWGRKGELEEDAAWALPFLALRGFAFSGLCRREPFWNLKVTLAPNPGLERKPDYNWGKVRLNVVPGVRPSERQMIDRVSRGVRLSTWSVLMSGNGDYPSRPHLATATLICNSDMGFNTIRVVAKSVNGIPMLEYCRRAGVGKRDDSSGPQRYVDLGSPLTGLSVPNPHNATALEIELVGYRSGETVNFVVDPSQAKS
jgi:hypothetical protein